MTTRLHDIAALETHHVIDRARAGVRIGDVEALALAECTNLSAMCAAATSLRDAGHGDLVTYSRKVFIPLTRLCRDVCHYCTFATAPRSIASPYLTPDAVLAIARAGKAAGCKEALFTLGDKPERRYPTAARSLGRLGYPDTISYLEAMARLVLEETGLLPHVNAGLMTGAELERLRQVSVSMGIMLESLSPGLARKGGPHCGSPDKQPAARLAAIDACGAARIPLTSGILVGIGETRLDRIRSLLALRAAHERHGHIQELIIQNFRAKPGTRMALAPEPDFADHLWTVAAARLVLGGKMSIQAPPNLAAGALGQLVGAGISDWGGVSPVTIDHINPEAPWPAVDALAATTTAAGKTLAERLAIYPSYLADADSWLSLPLRTPVLRLADADGLARSDDWTPGAAAPPPALRHTGAPAVATPTRRELRRTIAAALQGVDIGEAGALALFAARDGDFREVCDAADELRRRINGETISYVVCRNINYTNVCHYRCQFCAFSKGKLSENLRGQPYDLDAEEIARRVREAWQRGATEVCLQGGIHPAYTGETYLAILRVVKDAAPDIHVHAFSPLEVSHGAATLGVTLDTYLARLRDAGLASLPGTAAEILDDEVRRIICPDKIRTEEWLAVMQAAHRVGLRSTATIMFGHVDRPEHWARHLSRLRRLQEDTGGFTEFVPLPFVPTETPIYLKGRSRRGPTYCESVLMHAVARLALSPVFANVQTSWVKMGVEGAQQCLRSGANDLGGTLMNETISRAAGASHGQEMRPAMMERIAHAIGRAARQRSTLYDAVPLERQRAAQAPGELEELRLPPPLKRGARISSMPLPAAGCSPIPESACSRPALAN
jgi:FO synthase